MTFKLKHWIAFTLLLMVDQVSKLMAQLQGQVVLNPGVSFGLLFQVQYQVLSFILLAVVLVGLFLWQKYLAPAQWAAVWFFAGAVSNIIDRLLVAAVRDWLPVPLLGNKNNLADWFIFIGVILVFLFFLKKESNNDFTIA